MKNKFVFLMTMLSFLLILGTSQSYADLIIPDVDPPDENSTYWTDSDDNPSDWGELNNSNPGVTEEAWLEGILGLVYDDPSVEYLGGEDFDSYYIDYNPGYSWDYAVVKAGEIWYAYYDDPNNDFILVSFEGGHAVSHIDFFGSAPVPEPATMLLLGSGLIGLGAFGRKRFRK